MQELVRVSKNKKGFTLVEVIVVLVILAILATIAIPSLTGYIDKAKSKADMADARSAYVAAQTLASEEYATNPNSTSVDIAQINKLVGTDKYNSTNLSIYITDGKVASFYYVGAVATITLSGGKLIIGPKM